MPSNNIIKFKARPAEFALIYLQKEISLALIAPREKKPIHKKWQSKPIDRIEDARLFADHNVGMLFGVSSNWLIDIDLDCEEAIKLAKTMLPETAWRWGRKSRRNSHYLYCCKDAKTEKFAGPEATTEGSMILEIRSTGTQTIAPGSVHPDGELIMWESRGWMDEEPTQISIGELRAACSDLAAAVLILRHGWIKGKRDEVCLALCGLMLRAGRSEDQVDSWLEAIAVAAGDEELDMRLKAERQRERLNGDQRVPGIPRLKQLLGEGVAEKVLDWLNVKSMGLIERLNGQIALIMFYGGKPRIMVESQTRGLQFMTSRDAAELFEDLPQIKVRSKMVPAFQAWMESPDRRKYECVTFDPQQTKADPLTYNLWRGWPFADSPRTGRERCKMFLDHVRNHICNGDEKLSEYILDWLADAVQNPCKRPGVALILQSPQEGTGKTSFAEYVLKMYGHYGLLMTDGNHLFSKFNDAFINKLLVYGDEVTWAGDHTRIAILNNLITGNVLSIEGKYQGIISMTSYLRLMISTNNDWVMPISAKARRFCLVRVKPVITEQDKQFMSRYCEKMAQERDNGGAEALFQLLSSRNIKCDLRDFPKTEMLAHNRLMSMEREEPLHSWIHSRLSLGELPRGSGVWPSFVSNKDLFNDYRRFVTGELSVRGRYAFSDNRPGETSFGMAWKRVLPKTTYRYRPKRTSARGRGGRGYKFESLDQCREEFALRYLFVDYEWPED